MNRARDLRRPALAAAATVARLALLAASAVVISGCSAGAGAESTATPTTQPASSACSNADAGATKNQLVATPASLCELDGSIWTVSAFTLVVNTPEWAPTTPECDKARKTAFYDGREPAAIQTLDLVESRTESQNMIASVGISVIASSDAATHDAEGTACASETAQQVAAEHGAWKGVRRPTSQEEEDDRWTWWMEVDDRWAFVLAWPPTTRQPLTWPSWSPGSPRCSMPKKSCSSSSARPLQNPAEERSPGDARAGRGGHREPRRSAKPGSRGGGRAPRRRAEGDSGASGRFGERPIANVSALGRRRRRVMKPHP